MIPYLGSETYEILGLTWRTWGTLVALGFVVATIISWRRTKAHGLEARHVPDLAFWLLFGGLLGARLGHVFFYEPVYYSRHFWEILDLRQPGFAMFGGYAGAALTFLIYVRRKKLDFLAYADALVWSLPWGIWIGRLGCFLIHDHPGKATNLFLGVRYPDGIIRHDLGLDLSLLGLATGILFLILDRWPRGRGFWLGLFLLIEGLSRFTLDFLRTADVRYFGLTPTQFLAVPLAAWGIYLLFKSRIPNLKSISLCTKQ